MSERANVLAVDDKPANLFALENILRGQDLNFVKATSGKDALARLSEMEFACILLHTEVDGLDLARLVRGNEKTKDVPILFIGNPKKAGNELGMIDYIGTPVEPNILINKVNLFADRRRAEEALKTSEKRVRAIINNATDAFLGMDRHGLVTEWNASAEQTFGWKREEILGKTIKDTIIPHHMREAHFKGLARYLQTGEGPVLNRRLELSALHKEGREFPIEICISEVDAEDGAAFFAFVHDISERKRNEDAIRTAKEQLEHRVQERTSELTEQTLELTRSNEELARFAYVSSHDLKEPLRVVSLHTQLLGARHGDQLNAEAKECIRTVVEGATRMQKLIDGLLVYARVGRSEESLATVDCTGLLGRVVANLQASISEAGGEVKHGLLPVVEAREAQLTQVFQNLISNAIKFHGESPPLIEVGSKELESEYQFSVRDCGIGIDPEYQKKIFEIFQRLHGRETYPGTGIGLSVCKKIIELHGGRIWVESEEGRGATFFFTLPKEQRRGRQYPAAAC